VQKTSKPKDLNLAFPVKLMLRITAQIARQFTPLISPEKAPGRIANMGSSWTIVANPGIDSDTRMLP
jgi:hypothetical protein